MITTCFRKLTCGLLLFLGVWQLPTTPRFAQAATPTETRGEADRSAHWTTHAPRDELRPRFSFDPQGRQDTKQRTSWT